MKKTLERKNMEKATPDKRILSNCNCDNQIYYYDLKKRADLFSQEVATLTVKAQ
jgi:hypothetical protein